MGVDFPLRLLPVDHLVLVSVCSSRCMAGRTGAPGDRAATLCSCPLPAVGEVRPTYVGAYLFCRLCISVCTCTCQRISRAESIPCIPIDPADSVVSIMEIPYVMTGHRRQKGRVDPASRRIGSTPSFGYRTAPTHTRHERYCQLPSMLFSGPPPNARDITRRFSVHTLPVGRSQQSAGSNGKNTDLNVDMQTSLGQDSVAASRPLQCPARHIEDYPLPTRCCQPPSRPRLHRTLQAVRHVRRRRRRRHRFAVRQPVTRDVWSSAVGYSACTASSTMPHARQRWYVQPTSVVLCLFRRQYITGGAYVKPLEPRKRGGGGQRTLPD